MDVLKEISQFKQAVLAGDTNSQVMRFQTFVGHMKRLEAELETANERNKELEAQKRNIIIDVGRLGLVHNKREDAVIVELCKKYGIEL